LYNTAYDDVYTVTRFLARLKEDIQAVIALHCPKDVDTTSALPQKILSMASTTNGALIHHSQDQSWSASSLKPNIRFTSKSIVLHWQNHNSFIRSAIEVNGHLMESLFDKIPNISSPTLIPTSPRHSNLHNKLLFLLGVVVPPWAR
jgi:hypothetical protein